MPSFDGLRAYILFLIRPEIRTTFGSTISFSVEVEFESSKKPQKRNNFSDAPSEICEFNQGVELGVEDTRHFYLEWSRYVTHKTTLVVTEILQRKNLNSPGIVSTRAPIHQSN